MIDIKNLTIEKAHESLKKGEFTAVELAETYLKEIENKNKEISAYLEVYTDVLEQARRADQMIKEGKYELLTGIPLALKDNMLNEGKISTSGSKILENYRGTYDSTVVKKLKDIGAVILGRTNMDEFAMGSSTETSAWMITKNPKDVTRVPGGSSGGSAAALAMDGALFSLGSDTGGSIRQPASFCGLVGLKPTYGAVSRYGLMALASSLDQIGPFAKTVRDAEIVFDEISMHDPLDSTSVPKEKRPTLPEMAKRIGIPKGFITGEGINKEVLDNFNQSVDKLKTAGYELVEVDLPLIKYSLAVYYILMPAEASTNLARFDGIRYGLSVKGENMIDGYKKTRGQGFGKETRRRIMLGSYVLSHGYYDAYYNKAIKLQKQITADFKKIFSADNPNRVDAIITPTSPFTAFKIGEKLNDPVQMYLSDIFTVSANIGGIPAISIPSGMDSAGLPFGIQFMAPHFREDILFTIGKDFEILRQAQDKK